MSKKPAGKNPPASGASKPRASGPKLLRAPASDPLAQLRSTVMTEKTSDASGQERDAEQEAASSDIGSSPKAAADFRRELMISAIEATTTESQRGALRSRGQLAVVVIVPDLAWVGPMRIYFQQVLQFPVSFARDGSNRARDKSTVGNDEVSAHLAAGARVVGIAASVEMLPATLVSAADMRLTVAAPDARMVVSVMQRCLTGPLPDLARDDDLLAGLGLDDIVAAVRPRSTCEAAVARLRGVAAARTALGSGKRLPQLETAFEFGAARMWGLDLARDIADYRAGRISWSECSKGVILTSPPGFGKTILVQMIADSARVPLVVASIGDLFASSSGHLDGVIKATAEVFARALSLAPSILLWDELDALGNRATMDQRGKDWWSSVIGFFLSSLDGATNRNGVTVCATTNFPDEIDIALRRPGRLERVIEIAPLDLVGTANVLRYHLEGALGDDAIAEAADLMLGATPADLMMAVRDARRAARHAGRPLATEDLFDPAGATGRIPADLLFRMSVHESAHAVITLVLQAGHLMGVRLKPGGGSATVAFPDADMPTREDIERRVVSVLAGRSGERLLVASLSLGGGGGLSSDLAQATAMIASLHLSDGEGEGLSWVCPRGDAVKMLPTIPGLKPAVDRELAELQSRADGMVERHRHAILAVAAALSEKRRLTGSAVRDIIGDVERRSDNSFLTGGDAA
jgi:cell division protease FtsH